MGAKERQASAPQFDRVAELYDQTRALSPEAMRATVALLTAELRGREPCLEVGVGTGRVAVPLSRAGVELVGIDISEAMLAKLLAKGEGVAPFPIARADATRLPFAGGCFGSGLAIHVLHLLERWQEAARELLRTVRRAGVVIVNMRDDGQQSPWNEVNERFRQVAGLPPGGPGVNDPGELDAFFRSLGATPRELPAVTERTNVTIGELIRRLGDGVYSFTWSLEEGARRRTAQEVRKWAERAFPSSIDELRSEVRMRWRAYDLA